MPIYVFFLIFRTILLVIGILIITLYHLIKRKDIKPRYLLIILLIYLLFPSTTYLKDGGSSLVWSPLYEVITFKEMDSFEGDTVIPGRRGTYFFLFPNNTKDFTDVKDK